MSAKIAATMGIDIGKNSFNVNGPPGCAARDEDFLLAPRAGMPAGFAGLRDLA